MKLIYYYIFSVFDAQCVKKKKHVIELKEKAKLKSIGGKNDIKSVNMNLFKNNLRVASTQHFTLCHHLCN